MTLWDTLAGMGRRWYVVLIGLLCTALTLYAIQTKPSVYYSRSTVFFVSPSSQHNPNSLGLRLVSLVVTAGVVAKRINGNDTPTKVSSMAVTLVGRGVSDGTLIQLPDNGGQWSNDYDSQSLDIQIAAPTPELVVERRADAVTRIATELTAIQDEAKVPAVDRISLKVAPVEPSIVVMRGQPRRAQAMVAALGVVLTMRAGGLLELAAARRRRMLGEQA